MKPRTVATVLRVIADDKSIALFKIISQNDGIDGESIKGKIKITPKQYYSRLSKMTRSGLVRRKSGKYTVTSFGKMVYESQKAIDNALADFWKLKATTLLEISNGLSKKEQQKFIDTLFNDPELRKIIEMGDEEKTQASSRKQQQQKRET